MNRLKFCGGFATSVLLFMINGCVSRSDKHAEAAYANPVADAIADEWRFAPIAPPGD